MKKSRRLTKPLKLARETIRNMADAELVQIAGGHSIQDTLCHASDCWCDPPPI